MTHRLVTLLLLALAQPACLLDADAERALEQRRCAADAECASGLCHEGYCALRASDAGEDGASDVAPEDPDAAHEDGGQGADADPDADADAAEDVAEDPDAAEDVVEDVVEEPDAAEEPDADVADEPDVDPPSGCGAQGSCADGVAQQQVPSGFAFVAGGAFVMGSPPSEAGREAGKEDAREVRLTRDFVISQGELTNREWTQAGLPSPSDPPVQDADYPVHWVNFWEALAYLNARSRADGLAECYALQGCAGTLGGGRTGGNYTCQGATFAGLDCEGWRLPTEAEWEYAARAGASSAFPSGEITQSAQARWCDDPILDATAWYCGNAPLDANNNNMPIHTRGKQQGANAWGLFDTQGNLQEWTWDWYAPTSGAAQQPLVDPQGPASGSERVVRGGSANSDARQCRAASRNPASSAPAWSGQSAYTPAWRDRFTSLRPARTFR